LPEVPGDILIEEKTFKANSMGLDGKKGLYSWGESMLKE